MAVRLSALRACRLLAPERFLILISVRDWVDPRNILLLEGLGQLKNPMTSSGIEPACSIVPQTVEIRARLQLSELVFLRCTEGDEEHAGNCLVIYHNIFLYTIVLIVICRITEMLSYFATQIEAPLMWGWECEYINVSVEIHVRFKRLCVFFSLISNFVWHLKIVHFMRKVRVHVSIREVKYRLYPRLVSSVTLSEVLFFMWRICNATSMQVYVRIWVVFKSWLVMLYYFFAIPRDLNFVTYLKAVSLYYDFVLYYINEACPYGLLIFCAFPSSPTYC
jgi:hypothetical protein